MTGHLSQACLGLLEFSKVLQFPGLIIPNAAPSLGAPVLEVRVPGRAHL